MRRVLYVEPTGEIGGAEVSLLSLLQHLSHHIPLVVVPKQGRLAARLREMRVQAYVLPMPEGSRRNPLPWAWSVLCLARLCRRWHVNLVHANHEFANRHAWLAARIAGVPQICHVRNIQTTASFRGCWLALAPVLIANSKATERSYIAQIRTSQRSRVIYNGVDLSVLDGGRTKKETFGFGKDQFVIAQVGRLAPEKGVHIFVEAMASVATRYPHARAIVVGDAAVYGSESYANEVKRSVSRLGLTEKVVFTGFVDDIRSVYGAIDLLVQPSTCEPFGRTLVEAMAMKVPVIATNCGGAVEVVEDGVTGLLVPPGEASSLAEVIVKIIENREFGIRLGLRGRKRAEEVFSIEKHVARIEDTYAEVLSANWRGTNWGKAVLAAGGAIWKRMKGPPEM